MAKLITTAPDINLKDLSRNVWFWTAILALILMLFIAYNNGVFAGLGKCPEKEK